MTLISVTDPVEEARYNGALVGFAAGVVVTLAIGAIATVAVVAFFVYRELRIA